MGKFILGLLAILTATTTQAAVSDADRALIERGNNLLKNGGFESGKLQWTASGGTFSTTSTAANLGKGLLSGSFDSSSASQTLTSTAVAIPAGLYGRGGVASCIIQGAGATHTIQAYDGTNILASQTITSQANYARSSVNFIFPSSGNISLRVVSVAADEPTVYIDDCYLGDASGYNISQISQANLVGSAYFASTASCIFTRTSTTLGSLSDTDCPGPTVELNPGLGTIQTTDANSPIVTVNNLPSGNYIAHFVGQSYISTSSQLNALAINDGTTTAGQVAGPANTTAGAFHVAATFSYSSSGNRSFELYASSAANAVNIDLTASNQRLYFYLERFPSSAEIAYRADLVNAIGTVKYAGTTNCAWSGTTGSYTSFAADTDCPTPTTVGNGSAAGTKIPAGVFSNIPAGYYMVVASGLLNTQYSGSSTECLYRLYDGTTQIGTAAVTSYSNNTSNYEGQIVGFINYSSFQSSKTIEVQYTRTTGGGTCGINNGGSTVDFSISLIPMQPQSQAPLLVGSVTSNSSGLERIERVSVSNGGTCSISSQSGSWATLNSSTPANGGCTINISSGTFSATPSCVVSLSSGTTSTNNQSAYFTSVSSSAITWRVYNSSNVAQNDSVGIICMGPK